MGFLDSFFGSGGDVQNEHQELLNKDQRELLNKWLIPWLMGEPIDSIMGPEFQPSSGRLAPPLTSGQLTSLAALEQMAMSGGSLIPEAKGQISKIMGRGDSLGKEFEDFYQAGVLDPALKDYSEKIQPRIGRKYAESGFFSTDRRVADEQASNDLMKNLLTERTRLALGSTEQQLNAMGLIPDIMQAERDPYLTLLKAGDYARSAERELTDAEKEEFLRRIGERDKRIKMMFAALGIQPWENTATVEPSREGFFQSMILALLNNESTPGSAANIIG